LIIEWSGKPERICSNNGPEYINQKLAAWAKKNAIELCFIQLGNPQKNSYIERFNRTVIYDWLNHYIYRDIGELQARATQLLRTYNHERPNMGIGGITPIKKRELTQRNISTIELH